MTFCIEQLIVSNVATVHFSYAKQANAMQYHNFTVSGKTMKDIFVKR